MKRSLRVGLIGAGGITKSRHLPGLAKIPEVKLVAVSNRRRETAETVAKQWNIPHVVERWEDLVQRPDIDAVFIGTPPFLHKPISLAALANGKHVFCQARMAMNVEEAKQMVKAAEDASPLGIKAQICLAPHWLDVEPKVRELIHQEQLLGRITGVTALIGAADYLDPDRPLHWRQMQSVSGINVLQVGMIAEVLHRWFGYFRRVAAFGATFTPYRPLPNDETRVGLVDRPDAMTVSAEMENGALASLHFSHVMRRHETFVEAHGTKGSMRVVIDEPAVWINRGNGWERQEVPDKERGDWTAEADFVQSALNNTPIRYPNPSFTEGLRYMEFTEAVCRSADTGQIVTLPL